VVCSVFESQRKERHVRPVSVPRTPYYEMIRVLRLESYRADYEIRYGAEYLDAQIGARVVNHLLAQILFSSTSTSNFHCSKNLNTLNRCLVRNSKLLVNRPMSARPLFPS
jgi:hypothetical protein